VDLDRLRSSYLKKAMAAPGAVTPEAQAFVADDLGCGVEKLAALSA